MKPVISSPNVIESEIAGRRVFESRQIATGFTEDSVNVINPFMWFKPYINGGGISFDHGMGYHSGVVPIEIGQLFPSNTRVFLVETLEPSVGIITDSGFDYIIINDVARSAEITSTPPIYQSRGTIIRYPAASDSEIRIYALGYRDITNGLAVGEKIKYTLNADPTTVEYRVNRYPYYIERIVGWTIVSTTEAEQYYYSEAEILEDI